MKRIVGHGMKKNQECTKAAGAFTRNWAIKNIFYNNNRTLIITALKLLFHVFFNMDNKKKPS